MATETIADIVAYLRDPRNVVAATRIQRDLADRIEAAAARERNAAKAALAKVRGCADSTCGEMGVCKTCEVMGGGEMKVLKYAVGFMLGVALLPILPFVAAAAFAGFFAGEED